MALKQSELPKMTISMPWINIAYTRTHNHNKLGYDFVENLETYFISIVVAMWKI